MTTTPPHMLQSRIKRTPKTIQGITHSHLIFQSNPANLIQPTPSENHHETSKITITPRKNPEIPEF